MSQMKKINRRGTITRLIRMLFSYFPKLLPCIIVLICVNAVISSIPSVFQQKVIAIIQNAWENGLAWDAVRPDIMKNVATLASLYICSLLANVLYNQLMAFFTQGTLAKLRDEM